MTRFLRAVCSCFVYLWLAGMVAAVAGLVVVWGLYVVWGGGWWGVLIGGAGLLWIVGAGLASVTVLPFLLGGWWLEDNWA